MNHFLSKNSALLLFIIGISLLVVSELFYFVDKGFGKVGVILWYIFTSLLVIYAAKQLISVLKALRKHKSYFTLTTFLIIPVVILLFYAGRSENLSLESTQQIGCAINNFRFEDWGYFRNCFLGYPARQFYLPLLPSLIERSLLSLHIGNFLYFLIGWIIFVRSAVNHLSKNKIKYDLILAIILFLPLHFFYFNYLLLQFEQAGYSIGIGFAIVGLLLNLSHKFNYLELFLLTFLVILAISGYTIALAYIPITFLFLVLISIEKKIDRKKLFLMIITALSILLTFSVTYLYREDIRMDVNTSVVESPDKWEPLKALFNQPDITGYTSEIGFLFLAVILIGMASYRFRLSGVIVFLWSIGVIFLSVYTAGYANPETTFALYRSVVIIPFILGVLVYEKINFFDQKLLIIFFLVIAVLGIYFQYEHFVSKTNSKSIILHQVYENLYKNFDEDTRFIYLVNLDHEPYLPIKDGLKYFTPRAEVTFVHNLCQISENSNSYIIGTSALDNLKCYSDFETQIDIEKTFLVESTYDTFMVFKFEKNL